ncbi:hypothetical protein, partial [Burkholderia pseudomallei]|uniref:hypothetical protein n=1 Tax=Burkholderia pseudomallei TaxID=28450 RepID=UPI001EF9D22D
MTIAAHRVGLPLHRLMGVLRAVRLASRNECTASSMLTGLHRTYRHRETSLRIGRVNEKAREAFTLRALVERPALI